jgi:flagellar biosynthesis protein FlhG
MRDQAESLRKKLFHAQMNQSAKSIAIVSGKGGVGKTNFSVNYALSLVQQGKKVLLFDLDIGMGNVHLILGAQAEKTIADYITENCSLSDIIQHSHGLDYISGGNGLSELMNLDSDLLQRFLRHMESLQTTYDYLIFDMGAGAQSFYLQFLLSVQHIFVVTTPEPTAITDAYSMMKYITLLDHNQNFYLVCNRVEDDTEGREVLQRLKTAVKKFLQKDVHILGMIPEDKTLKKAVLAQQPVVLAYPKSKVAKAIQTIPFSFEQGRQMVVESMNFIQRLRTYLLDRRGTF